VSSNVCPVRGLGLGRWCPMGVEKGLILIAGGCCRRWWSGPAGGRRDPGSVPGLVYAGASAHPPGWECTPSTARRARLTPAAEQVREFAFHGGAVRAVVGPPGGIPLPLAGSSEQRLVGVDADRATGAAAGAPAGEQADGAGAAEAGQPAPGTGRDDRHGEPGGAGDRLSVQVDGEPVRAYRPSGAVAGATLSIATTPRPSRSASSAPVP
jgi:hypothetical protein